MKKIKKTISILGGSLVSIPVAAIVACSPTEQNKRKTNQTIDFTKHGIAKHTGSVKTRELLFPAAKNENKLDANGIFNIGLHHSPVEGVQGEWVAFATEVKSETDNTLVEPVVIKQATTKATNGEFPLRWKFEGENKLQDGKFYTFIFWKKDGTEKIVFSPDNIKNSKDVFLAKLPEGTVRKTNQTIDFTKHGITKHTGSVKTRELLFPADKSNKLDAKGIFNIGLHLAPVQGVQGEWVAFATEVKSETDNTLVEPVVIKQATTTATSDDFPLRWKFEGENKLQDGKFYTFIFWKKDGTEKIVFSTDNIKNSKDVFPAKLPA
ncbi:hypothetical protein RRG43_02100 [Mycoplasmopsis cynos]|uniref:hypothetical protein n=1 Tax=Mycoplasmopsis cynos TaxID=171284 RepID=UPI002AFF6200|nr:hypothetical protein [Mycoplasmopsis cynos]WQQ15123.1 hypothetical protein RRG43_02100 [Mycoplasmopsis cynos]